MKILDYFNIVLKNFRKKKLRMGINIFAISIGVMFTVTLISMNTSIQHYLSNKMDELYTLKQVSLLPIEYKTEDEINKSIIEAKTLSDIDYKDVAPHKDIKQDVIDKLLQDERVEDAIIKYEDKVSEIEVNKVKMNDVSLVSYRGKKYLSVEEKSIAKSENDNSVNYIAYGEDITDSSEKSILITEDLANITFKDKSLNEIIGKEITIKTYPNEKDITKEKTLTGNIVGIIDSKYFQPSIVVSKDLMKEVKNFYLNEDVDLFERGPDKVQFALKNVNDVEDFVSLIETEYRYTTESVQNVAKTINNLLSYLNIFFFGIGFIVISIAALGIVNTMSMSVYERTKSIGLMKAIGASNKDILRIFLLEGGTIGFIGTIFGFIFSNINLALLKTIVVNTNVLTNFTIEDMNLLKTYIGIDSNIVLITLFTTVFLSILASLYPSLKASKLNPIDALKYD